MKAIFCLLLIMSVLFVSVGMVGCDQVEETVSIKKISKDFSEIKSTVDEKDEWVVTRKRVAKKNNGLVEESESIRAELLGIENPEHVTQQELLSKFETYDQKRREEALRLRCEIQECHGLDVSCGLAQEHRACTLEYRLGDFCRQFLKCDIVDGECVKVESETFEQCRDCVSQCHVLGVEDSWGCEGKCRERFLY